MAAEDEVPQAHVSACAAAKAAGNSAYACGELDKAWEHYMEALHYWDEALGPPPAMHEVGRRVRYSKHGFGQVMSAFTMFDEYFLKDLGTDQAIWAGDPGGELKRFSARELRPVSDELFDLRFAIAQNLAAVSLKRALYQEAIEWADAALSMDGKAPKALMRLGAALLRSGKPGPASDRLAAAQKAMPNDPEVRKLLKEAELKRSPTWICANGCCGPWGIVCGGPQVDAMAEAVKPQFKNDAILALMQESDSSEEEACEEKECKARCKDRLSEAPKPESAAPDMEEASPEEVHEDSTMSATRPDRCWQLAFASVTLGAVALAWWQAS